MLMFSMNEQNPSSMLSLTFDDMLTTSLIFGAELFIEIFILGNTASVSVIVPLMKVKLFIDAVPKLVPVCCHTLSVVTFWHKNSLSLLWFVPPSSIPTLTEF